MYKKIVGWILISASILAIVWGVWTSAQIFTAKTTAPEIFKESTVNKLPAIVKQTGTAQEQAQQQMENIINEQIGKMLPAGSVIELLNLIAWSIFMTILIFASGKVAGIGIKLLA